MEEMQTALLDKSGMGKFVTLETKHRANSSSNEHKHLYRDVDCEVIRKVVDMFKMDMMLFQYSAEQYLASGSVHC
jgi:glucuronate isomerase